MSKVFSVKEFKKSCKKHKCLKEDTKKDILYWAKKCDGLTAEEMKEKYNFGTVDEWMVEKEG